MSMYPTNIACRGIFHCLLLILLLAAPAVAQDRVTYYHTDHAGSPVAATDAGGEVLWRESYAPYGSRLMRQAPANELWFTGKREDATLGLHYFGARWYDADLGRFISIDPAGFDENNIQLFNRYAYANNNPYGYVDPDGGLPFAIPLVWAGKGLMALGAGVSGHAVGTGGYELATGQKTAGEAVRDTAVNVGIGLTLKGGGGVLLNAFDKVTRGVGPQKLYHYTRSQHADSIAEAGLRRGSGGQVFTTPHGNLSPIQAQIDLALPANRGLPNSVFEIDVATLRRLGIGVPPPSQVGRSFNMPGGGLEVPIRRDIPPEALRRIQ